MKPSRTHWGRPEEGFVLPSREQMQKGSSTGTGLGFCKENSEALAWFPGKENSVSQRRH